MPLGTGVTGKERELKGTSVRCVPCEREIQRLTEGTPVIRASIGRWELGLFETSSGLELRSQRIENQSPKEKKAVNL